MRSSICPDCNGTGVDRKKTAMRAKQDAEFKYRVKHHGSYIRCWSCNGNGDDSTQRISWGKNQLAEDRSSVTEKVIVPLTD